MKKKIFLVLALAAVTAVPVFAAATSDQTQNEWYNQMFNRHQQVMQQAVKDGKITADEAEQMSEHMKEMAPIMQKMRSGGCPMADFNDRK